MDVFLVGLWIVGILCLLGLLVCWDWPPYKTYDDRYRIVIVDKDNLDSSGVPVGVKCDTCGWSTEVVPGGVPEEAAERHRMEHEHTMNMVKSARVTFEKRG